MEKIARQNSRGQTLILILLLMVTFISFFTFVINTGLLINAKINLQNAADLAAYTGAAVQARQLNTISFLNYEMRRQLKKFLYRYYVVGNMAQKSHNQMGDDDSMRIWSPTGSPGDNYGVPTVCLIFNPDDNYCQIQKLQKIDIPKGNPFSTISMTLEAQLTALEEIRQNVCDRIEESNRLTLALWLYNTEPDLKSLDDKINSLAGDDQAKNLVKAFKTIKGLATGLGLVPRLMLLDQRIRTLEGYVNAPAQTAIRYKAIKELESSAPDPSKSERTIEAFLTAFNTLGNHNFIAQNVMMDELLPVGSDSTVTQMIQLEPIQISFDSYYLAPKVAGTPGSGEAKDCEPYPANVPVKDVTVGFYKNPELLIYYAVRLRGEVNLMFSPFGSVAIKAYAAAQPFGSRIGPSLEYLQTHPTWDNPDGVPFVSKAEPRQPSGATNSPCFGGKCRGLLNLPVRSNIDSGGWLKNYVLKAMGDKLTMDDGTGLINKVITPDDLEKAYAFAMAPNPSEKGLYNVVNSLSDPFKERFPATNGDPSGYFQVWAPLVPLDKGGGSPTEAIEQAINTNTGIPDELKAAMLKGLSNYIVAMTAGDKNKTQGETMNTLPLANPFFNPIKKTEIKFNAAFPILMETQESPPAPNSSWSDVRRNDYKDMGRLGYSVKIISFKYLMNPASAGGFTDGFKVPWINTPNSSIDKEAQTDLKKLEH